MLKLQSIRITGNCAIFYDKRPPVVPDEKYLIIDDGKKMEVDFFSGALMW